MGILVLCIFLFLGLSSAEAKQSGVQMEVQMPKEAKLGEVLSVTVKVENTGNSRFQGFLTFNLPSGFILLNDPLLPIQLNSESQRFYPIRIKIDKNSQAGINEIQAFVRDSKEEILIEKNFQVEIASFRKITLQILDPLATMHISGESVKTRLLVKNQGNQEENVKIVVSYPIPETGSYRYEELPLRLRPNQDSILNLAYTVDRSMMKMDRYVIAYNGIMNQSDIFGNAQFVIQNTSSRRTFQSNSVLSSLYSPNQITYSTRNFWNDYASNSLYGSGSFYNRSNQYDFSFNMFQQGYTEIPTINNSWFKFDRNNKGFTAGNIYLNEEMNLNGRGLTINLGDSAAFNTVQFGAMDKSYSLYDPNEIYTPGWSGFVKSNHIFGDENPTEYQVFAAYDKDSRNFSESYLVFNEIEKSNYSSTQFIKSYKFQLGAGLNRAYIPENFTSTLPTETPANSSFKPSLAGGWQVQGSWKKFFTSSGAFFSGGYFPGQRRGTTQLNQRIGWRINSSSIWGEYQLNSFSPEVFNPFQRFNPYFRLEKIEMGISFPFNSFSNLSIAPRIEKENGVYIGQNQEIEQFNSRGVKVISNFYWRSRNSKHYLTLSNEAGRQTSGTFSHINKWNSLTNLSYNFLDFQLTAQHQLGSFSVTDYLFSDFLLNTPERYAFSGNWNKELFKNKVRANIYYTYYKDNSFSNGHSVQSRIQYRWNRTELFAHNQLQIYNSRGRSSTPYLDFQLGITQRFHSNSKNTKTGNLEIRAFYDYNQNGVFDSGDELAERKSVLIQKILFQADRNGKVSYKRIPYGEYLIQVPVENNWYAPNSQILINKKNQKLDIALRKSSSLRGRIIYDYDPLLSLEAEIAVEGFTVIAKSASGEVYRTRTDNIGNYMLFLPAGDYTLSINEIELPQNVYIEMNHLFMKTETGQVNSAPDFVFKVKERSIEIRRFGT